MFSQAPYKLFLSFVLSIFYFFGSAQVTSDFSLEKFSSVCSGPEEPRTFTLNFNLVATSPGDMVMLSTPKGSFKGQEEYGYKISLINNKANVSLTFHEGVPDSMIYIMGTLYNNGVPVGGAMSQHLLTKCGTCCLTEKLVLHSNGVFLPPHVKEGDPEIYCSFSGDLEAGPDSVSSINTVILNSKRRTICNDRQPGEWQSPVSSGLKPLKIDRLVTTEIFNAKENAYSLTYNPPTHQYTPIHKFRGDFLLPRTKIEPSCSEEYNFDLELNVVFNKKCTRRVTKNLVFVRP